MKPIIYLRALMPEDAAIACHWRNNPKIWAYTKRTVDHMVTKEMEREWIVKVNAVTQDKRFAICLQESQQYIGNIQLVGIKNREAHFHIFIGEECCWGKGIAQQATTLLLDYAFTELEMKTILLDVHQDNHAGMAIYQKTGFKIIGQKGLFVNMILTKGQYYKAKSRSSEKQESIR